MPKPLSWLRAPRSPVQLRISLATSNVAWVQNRNPQPDRPAGKTADFAYVLPHARRPWALLLLIALAWTWYCHFWPFLHPGQEALRLYQVQALAERGESHLDAMVARHGSVPTGHRPRANHVYGEPAPGLAVLSLPLYAVAQQLEPQVAREQLWRFGYAATVLTVAAPLLAMLIALYGWLIRRVSPQSARVSIAALATASPLLIYAGLYSVHGLAAALVGASFFVITGSPDTPLSPRRAWTGGILLGYAGLSDTPVFVLGALLTALTYARALPAGPASWSAARQALRQVAPVALGLAGGIAGQLLYNGLALGDPWQAELPDGVTQWLALPRADALVGLWLTPRRGLLYHAPWLAAAVAGLAMVIASNRPREQRLEACGALAVSGLYALFISGWGAWPAGDQAGARHLLPIVPLLAWGLGPLWQARLQPQLRGALLASVAAGVLLHAPTAATFPYHFEQVQRPVLELAVPLMIQSAWSPSIGAWFGMGGTASAAVYALILAAVWWMALARGWVQQDPQTLRPWLLPLSTAVVLLVWAVGITSAVPEKPGRAAEVSRYKAAQLLKIGLHGRGP